jgi:hypothetical protein
VTFCGRRVPLFVNVFNSGASHIIHDLSCVLKFLFSFSDFFFRALVYGFFHSDCGALICSFMLVVYSAAKGDGRKNIRGAGQSLITVV